MLFGRHGGLQSNKSGVKLLDNFAAARVSEREVLQSCVYAAGFDSDLTGWLVW